MVSNNKKEIHQIIKVPFANTEFSSIRVEGVDHYPLILLPKDPTGLIGFPVRQEEPSQDIKRILGNDFQSVNFKFSTNLNPKQINCLSHEGLAKLVVETAKKGCAYSWTLLEASFDVELKRANDYIRGEQAKEEDYQAYLAERADGIQKRNLFTSFIKQHKDLGVELDYSHLTVNVYRHVDVLDQYWNWKKEHPNQNQRNKNPFRNTLTWQQLRDISVMEENAAKAGKRHKMNPNEAIQWVVDNL